MGKFVIKTRTNGEFQFNLKADNGEVVLTSEGYTQKAGCENGIASVKINAADASNFDKKTSSNDKFYFNLKAGNGQVIGTSEMYETEEHRNNGIASVMSNATDASIEDTTTA